MADSAAVIVVVADVVEVVGAVATVGVVAIGVADAVVAEASLATVPSHTLQVPRLPSTDPCIIGQTPLYAYAFRLDWLVYPTYAARPCLGRFFLLIRLSYDHDIR